MKAFDNQILDEKLDLVYAKLKCKKSKDILIQCLVKDICQPLTGRHISHTKGKFRHLQNIKLAHSNIMKIYTLKF